VEVEEETPEQSQICHDTSPAHEEMSKTVEKLPRRQAKRKRDSTTTMGDGCQETSEARKRMCLAPGTQHRDSHTTTCSPLPSPLPSPARAPSRDKLPLCRGPATPVVSAANAGGAIATASGGGSGVSARRIRLTVLASRSGNTVCVQLAELALRCGQSEHSIKLDGFQVENPRGQSPIGEGAEKLLSPTGKWLDFNFRKQGQSVLVLEAPEEFMLDNISLRTASDHPARDPARLRVESSSSPSSPPAVEPASVGVASGRGRGKGRAASRGIRESAELDQGDDWKLLFEDDVEAPLERRAWSKWLALRRPSQELVQDAPAAWAQPARDTPLEDAPAAQAQPARDAPLEDLLHVLLHATPGGRIDVKATVDSVGELEVQELRLQPGESTASRTLDLRLRDGSICEWRLWGGDAEKYGVALLGRQVIVRSARATKFNRRCLLNGCTGVDVCT